MKKVLYTLIYGDWKTRFTLLLMAVGFLGGFGILVYALIIKNYIAVLSAMILLAADIGMILSTDFKTLLLNPKGKNNPKKAPRKKASKPDSDNDDDDNIPAFSDLSKKSKKKNGPDEEINDPMNPSSDESAKLPSPEPLKKPFDLNDIEDDVNPLTLYDKKSLKQLLIKYKVKQEHVLILIDECKKQHIFECPAILWKDKAFAYILLLEKEPRMIKFNYYDHNEMHICAAVDANPAREYKDFKEKSFLSELYTPLLPNYTSPASQSSLSKKVYKKALYGIGPNIFCTSNSVKNIMQILSLNMVLTESKIQKNSYSDWFKRIYISRLMYRDKIFSPQEYKDQVMALLGDMSENATDEEFSDSITQMLLGGLIPQEYAEYATYKRNNR